MDRRGTLRAVPAKAPRTKPDIGPAPGMSPERYVDHFFQDLARRINRVRRGSRWHVEARRFLLDLGKIPELSPGALRRA